MKKICLSVSNVLALLAFVAAVGLTATTAEAQTRDKYLISAKAGGINYVSGNVTVNRSGSNRQESLTDKDNLENGDVVTTGMGGRVEVLLSPGSYMRVGENSEFELADTSLDNIRIKLTKGSTIIEAVKADDMELALRIDTPQTAAQIVKSGIYRINVTLAGTTEVLVRKGRALVGTPAEMVKAGQMISVSRGMTEIAKLDKKRMDSLELWSRDRAEYLASINRQIQPRALMANIIDYSAENSWMNYRDYRNRGAWVYDSARQCYVFLPGRGNANSPYGYGYTTWGGTGCGCVNGRGRETPPTVPNPPPNGGNGNGPVAGGNPPPDTPSRENSPGNGGSIGSGGGGGGRGNDTPPPSRGDYSAPVVSSPPSPPPSTPPSSPPSSSPSGTSAPMVRDNPND